MSFSKPENDKWSFSLIFSVIIITLYPLTLFIFGFAPIFVFLYVFGISIALLLSFPENFKLGIVIFIICITTFVLFSVYFLGGYNFLSGVILFIDSPIGMIVYTSWAYTIRFFISIIIPFPTVWIIKKYLSGGKLKVNRSVF